MKVVYANGQPDDIRVRREVKEGSDTGPLDLKGRDRAITQIELITKATSRAEAKVEQKFAFPGSKMTARETVGHTDSTTVRGPD